MAYRIFWSEWRDSNARPLAPKASALPLGYTRLSDFFIEKSVSMGFYVVIAELQRVLEKYVAQRLAVCKGLCGSIRFGVSSSVTLPNQARYQLRYTPMIILMWSPLWSNMWSTAVF